MRAVPLSEAALDFWEYRSQLVLPEKILKVDSGNPGKNIA